MDPQRQSLSMTELGSYIAGMRQSALGALVFMGGIARRYFLLILAAGALAGAGAYWMHRNESPYFESRMCCSFNDNHQKIFGEMIARLDQHLHAGDKEEVAALLQLPVEQVRPVLSVEARNLAKGKLEEDFSGQHLPFYIYLRTTDRNSFNVWQHALLAYLNNNDMSRSELGRKIQKWQERTAFYDAQLAKLDSLKEAIRIAYINAGASQVSTGSVGSGITDLYRFSDSMSFLLSDARYYAAHYQTVQQVYGFSPDQHPSRPALKAKVIQYSILAVLGAWLLTGLIVWVRQQQRKDHI